MKALDLFCGLGGWSDGLAAEGFDILGVEINEEIAGMYKHKVIVADVCELDPEEFRGNDLIVGSPPCRDFSHIGKRFGHNWKRPPDPEGEGMRLIDVFLDFVSAAQPRFWCMENVPYAAPWVERRWGIKPRSKTYIGQSMRRALWGTYPAFLIPRDMNKKTFMVTTGRTKTDRKVRRLKGYSRKMGKWEMAKIPLPLSRALGRSVGEAIK